MTAWNAIENIINDDPNVTIRLEPIAYSMGSTCLSITISLIDPETLRPLYNIRRIIDYNEMKDKTKNLFVTTSFGETKYENVIGNLIEHMYLDLKFKSEALNLSIEKEETE